MARRQPGQTVLLLAIVIVLISLVLTYSLYQFGDVLISVVLPEGVVIVE